MFGVCVLGPPSLGISRLGPRSIVDRQLRQDFLWSCRQKTSQKPGLAGRLRGVDKTESPPMPPTHPLTYPPTHTHTHTYTDVFIYIHTQTRKPCCIHLHSLHWLYTHTHLPTARDIESTQFPPLPWPEAVNEERCISVRPSHLRVSSKRMKPLTKISISRCSTRAGHPDELVGGGSPASPVVACCGHKQQSEALYAYRKRSR